MKWKGDKYHKEIKTDDGYLLKIELVKDERYWWAVFKDGTPIVMAKEEKDFKTNISAAQKTAQLRMIKHLKMNIKDKAWESP